MNTRVSLVIPVYNEADRIHDCLTAVARQSVKPYEVIVVDNNSTDGTAAVAASFPFVTILHESRQGVVYARDRGFNAARGDIIGRIDADTLIADNWVQTIQNIFAQNDVDLITGAVRLHDISAAHLASRVDLFWRRYLARKLGNHVGLQGANMALKRSVWQAIASSACHRAGIHEDFDLGLHAYQAGYKGGFYEAMVASVCHRQLETGLRRFSGYALTSPRTYLAHGHVGGWHMYPIVAFVISMYPIILLLSRGYDEKLKRFSFSALTATSMQRVNPALYVD